MIDLALARAHDGGRKGGVISSDSMFLKIQVPRCSVDDCQIELAACVLVESLLPAEGPLRSKLTSNLWSAGD